jgi:hypothetical protein
MKNILIFFGKSQDFTFHAFDDQNYLKDFNSIIKNFNDLESQYFNIDEIENREILAYYNHIEGVGQNYSMLKLYDFAQAVDGNRIAGSSFGVALLSNSKLKLSQNNLNILRVAFDNFNKLSIRNKKFINSDFFNEVSKIWKALVENEKGNIINQFSTVTKDEISINGSSIGVFVDNIEQLIHKRGANDLPFDKIYFTSDIGHLKRANTKWGNQFKIYQFGEKGLETYSEKIIKTDKPENKDSLKNPGQNLSSLDDLKLKDLKEEVEQLNDIIHIKELKIKKLKMMILAMLTIITLLLLISILKKSEDSEKKSTNTNHQIFEKLT